MSIRRFSLLVVMGGVFALCQPLMGQNRPGGPARGGAVPAADASYRTTSSVVQNGNTFTVSVIVEKLIPPNPPEPLFAPRVVVADGKSATVNLGGAAGMRNNARAGANARVQIQVQVIKPENLNDVTVLTTITEKGQIVWAGVDHAAIGAPAVADAPPNGGAIQQANEQLARRLEDLERQREIDRQRQLDQQNEIDRLEADRREREEYRSARQAAGAPPILVIPGPPAGAAPSAPMNSNPPESSGPAAPAPPSAPEPVILPGRQLPTGTSPAHEVKRDDLPIRSQ